MPQPGSIAKDDEVIKALQAFIAEAGSRKVAAHLLKVHPKYISLIIHGNKPIPLRVAFKLGYLPTWLYMGSKK
jgi:hypothetical protein